MWCCQAWCFVAARLGSETVSFWAGVPRAGVDHAQARGWLDDGLAQVLDHAEAVGVDVALFAPGDERHAPIAPASGRTAVRLTLAEAQALAQQPVETL